MRNNKGFTLTEVLLAAMIVGIIGIALAALTTAALRESSTGRSRMLLRNQLSLFLRQLRQDVQKADEVSIEPPTTEDSSAKVSLSNEPLDWLVTYTCEGGSTHVCKRQEWKGDESKTTTVLNHVQRGTEDWSAPLFEGKNGVPDGNQKVLHVRLIVGVDGEPPVKEAIEETFVLP